MANGKPLDQNLAPYVEETIRYINRLGNLSEASLESYKDRMVTVLNRAQLMGLPTNPVEITRLDATRFIDELLQNGLHVDTIKLYARMLNDYAAAHGNMALQGLNTHMIKPVKGRWLSSQNLNRIFRTVMSIEHVLIFHLMVCLGLKKKDLTLLRMEDIDMDAGTIRIAEGGRIVKFHKVDEIIPQDTKALLEEYIDYRRNLIRWKTHLNPDLKIPDTLFIYDRGDELYPFLSTSTTIDNRLRDISKLTGVHLTEKILGVTCARCLIYSNVPFEEATRIMGIKLPDSYWQGAN